MLVLAERTDVNRSMPSEEVNHTTPPDLPMPSDGQKSPSKPGSGEADPENPEHFFVTEVENGGETPGRANVELQPIDEPVRHF